MSAVSATAGSSVNKSGVSTITGASAKRLSNGSTPSVDSLSFGKSIVSSKFKSEIVSGNKSGVSTITGVSAKRLSNESISFDNKSSASSKTGILSLLSSINNSFSEPCSLSFKSISFVGFSSIASKSSSKSPSNESISFTGAGSSMLLNKSSKESDDLLLRASTSCSSIASRSAISPPSESPNKSSEDVSVSSILSNSKLSSSSAGPKSLTACDKSCFKS